MSVAQKDPFSSFVLASSHLLRHKVSRHFQVHSLPERAFLQICSQKIYENTDEEDLTFDQLHNNFNVRDCKQNEQIKLWLIACLVKTLKEQVGLIKLLPQLNN